MKKARSHTNKLLTARASGLLRGFKGRGGSFTLRREGLRISTLDQEIEEGLEAFQTGKGKDPRKEEK